MQRLGCGQQALRNVKGAGGAMASVDGGTTWRGHEWQRRARCRSAMVGHYSPTFTHRTRGVYGAPRRGRGAGVKGASGAWSAGWAAVAWSAVSGALVSKRTQFTCLCGECDGGAQGTDRLCCNQEQRAPRAARGWRQRLQHGARPQVQYEGATLPPPPNSAHQRYRKRLSTAGVVRST